MRLEGTTGVKRKAPDPSGVPLQHHDSGDPGVILALAFQVHGHFGLSHFAGGKGHLLKLAWLLNGDGFAFRQGDIRERRPRFGHLLLQLIDQGRDCSFSLNGLPENFIAAGKTFQLA